MKTFDIEFQVSLENLIIFHEQLMIDDNQHLRFLTAEYDETDKSNPSKLVRVYILHTSPDNPLFTSPKYDKLENKIQIHLNKLIVTLQLEAMLSLMRFQDNIMQKYSSSIAIEQIKTNQSLEKIANKDKSIKKDSMYFFFVKFIFD